MKKIYLGILFFVCMLTVAQAQLILNSQFINPCGGDEHNEFIVARSGTDAVNIADMAFASYDPANSTAANPNYNYWWAGSNIPSSPYPAFSNFPNESCGTMTGITCYGFRYPSNSTDKADIDDLIGQLNTAAGCNVFLPVPTTDIIPANSVVVIFIGAGYRNATGLCGFDNVAANLNFANHCNAGVPTATYYAVFGTGGNAGPNCSNTGSGYFSNTDRRVSILHTFKGGDNTVMANYVSTWQDYDPGSSGGAGNAGIIVPSTTGSGTDWINNQGCVPAPSVIVPVKFEYFTGALKENAGLLKWKTSFEEAIKTFVIEKSFNGRDFAAFKSVAPGNISGSTYYLTDNALAGGNNFYRLKVINLDGTIDYSAIVRINYTKGALSNWYISPNPASGNASVIYKSNTSKVIFMKVTDAAGKLISSSTYSIRSGTNKLNIPSAKLSSGMYVINLVSGDTKETAVFVKQQ